MHVFGLGTNESDASARNAAARGVRGQLAHAFFVLIVENTVGSSETFRGSVVGGARKGKRGKESRELGELGELHGVGKMAR